MDPSPASEPLRTSVVLDQAAVHRVTFLNTDDDHLFYYFIPETSLQAFLTALYEQKVDPGIDPHTNEKNVTITRIAHSKLDAESAALLRKYSVEIGPKWWTTPGLKENGDSLGAVFLKSAGLPDEPPNLEGNLRYEPEIVFYQAAA